MWGVKAEPHSFLTLERDRNKYQLHASIPLLLEKKKPLVLWPCGQCSQFGIISCPGSEWNHDSLVDEAVAKSQY